ncbi:MULTISPECIES: hypothetical protein [Paenibacillus]|uniref:hypothetical protein n=1 Tax=Paenibacillus TaxID=44249 RepID=UPI0022B8E8C0|nr:hypothetical protein [Paenibacillus caseinilyticus]MCZ8521946.1 hypothetical protein [Paenibacillus caseinilyticus]
MNEKEQVMRRSIDSSRLNIEVSVIQLIDQLAAELEKGYPCIVNDAIRERIARLQEWQERAEAELDRLLVHYCPGTEEKRL